MKIHFAIPQNEVHAMERAVGMTIPLKTPDGDFELKVIEVRPPKEAGHWWTCVGETAYEPPDGLSYTHIGSIGEPSEMRKAIRFENNLADMMKRVTFEEPKREWYVYDVRGTQAAIRLSGTAVVVELNTHTSPDGMKTAQEARDLSKALAGLLADQLNKLGFIPPGLKATPGPGDDDFEDHGSRPFGTNLLR